MDLFTEPSRTSVSMNHLPFGTERFIFVRENTQNSSRTENSTSVGNLPFIVGYLRWITGQVIFCMYLLGCQNPTFASTNNIQFGNKWPISPEFIDNGETVLDFWPEADVFNIRASRVNSFFSQSKTRHILQMTDDFVRLVARTVFKSSVVCAKNTLCSKERWDLSAEKSAEIMNQLLFLWKSTQSLLAPRVLLQCKICARISKICLKKNSLPKFTFSLHQFRV